MLVTVNSISGYARGTVQDISPNARARIYLENGQASAAPSVGDHAAAKPAASKLTSDKPPKDMPEVGATEHRMMETARPEKPKVKPKTKAKPTTAPAE